EKTETYTITSSYSKWVTIGNNKITIDSGKSETFAVWIKPGMDAEAGQHVITLTAIPDSDKSTKYEDSLDLIIMKCHALEIIPEKDIFESCIGETKILNLIISNTGKTEEAVILSSSTGSSDTEYIRIPSDEEKTVTLSIPVASNEEIITVEARSTTSYASATTQIKIVSEGACYGIAVLNIPPEISVCKEDTAKIAITTKNTGYKTGTFKLSTDIENAYFKKEEQTLESKEVAETYLEISTENLEIGEFEYSVTIKSEKAVDKAYGKITVEQCYEVDISTDRKTADICPGSTTSFEIEVKNTGKKEDTYTIEANEGHLSETSISLNSGDSKKILLLIETSREDAHDKNILINIRSDKTEKTEELTAYIKNFIECYGVSVASDTDSIFAEELKGYLYTLTVKNDGEFDAEYTAILEGPKWISINPKELFLEPGESAEIFVYASPEYNTAKGTYNINVKIKSDVGIITEKQLQFAFKSKDTVAPVNGIVTDNATEPSDDTQPDISDKEDTRSPINIITAIIIGIIIILLILFGPELIKKEEKKEKETDEEKEKEKPKKAEVKKATKKAEIKKVEKPKKRKPAPKPKKTTAKKDVIRKDRKDDIEQILDNI
ncbi:MAG: hypothetical protein U9P44_03370, partial [archaeon]|nr:hypothetical protein [archaeon]